MNRKERRAAKSRGTHAIREKGGREVPQTLGADGYYRVILWKDGKPHVERVDELVLGTFGEPRPSEDHVVEHIDGDRGNDFIENLRWVLP